MSQISGRTDHFSLQVRYLNPDLVVDASLLARLTSWLDETETKRMQRLVNPRHRHSFLVSHALTRKLLANAIGCTPDKVCFGVTGRNKPVLANTVRATSACHFNLSHTHGMAVVAVGPVALGVDTEWLARKVEGPDLADRYFSDNECADIKNQPQEQRQQRFLTYWTLKEAFLKAQAWGIVDRLDGFEFELNPKGHLLPQRIRLRVREASLAPTHPWRFHHWQVSPEHLVSLAISARLNPDTAIEPRQWTESDWD